MKIIVKREGCKSGLTDIPRITGSGELETEAQLTKRLISELVQADIEIAERKDIDDSTYFAKALNSEGHVMGRIIVERD